MTTLESCSKKITHFNSHEIKLNSQLKNTQFLNLEKYVTLKNTLEDELGQACHRDDAMQMIKMANGECEKEVENEISFDSFKILLTKIDKIESS